MYDEVEQDFSTFYRALSGADEEKFTAKLNPPLVASLDVNFYGRGYTPLSATDKTRYLTARATESGYEHHQTKILARTVAGTFRVTHLYEDVGDKEFWRRGGIATVVVEREVRVGEPWYVSCFQRG